MMVLVALVVLVNDTTNRIRIGLAWLGWAGGGLAGAGGVGGAGERHHKQDKDRVGLVGLGCRLAIIVQKKDKTKQKM